MSISYYYSLLRKQQNQYQRLQNCKRQLVEKQQEYSSYRQNVTDPDLSSNTWHGTLATRFQEIRLEGMLQSYLDIEIEQFSNVFTALDNTIQQIQSEINSTKQTIADLEAKLSEEIIHKNS